MIHHNEHEGNDTPQSKRTEGNVQRTPEYIKLKHCITSCENILQLETIKETILKYYRDKKTDAPELLSEWHIKEHEFNPNN